MQHEPCTKPDSPPFGQIVIDSLGVPSEVLSRAIQFAVVTQVMNTYFESVSR